MATDLEILARIIAWGEAIDNCESCNADENGE